MVVNESTKPNRSVRPKLKTNVSNDSKVLTKSEKKHRLKQRFEVLKKLGQGTYGKVQLAINKDTGQEVAIKTIKKSKVESEQDLVRIRREIQIMSSIQHPHIIHIYEVFENKDKIVLVMQYASGGEVYDYVSDRKVLNDSEARRLFRQIATAIYYCHKNKICHRDLKLENILLDEKGNAKIADFGLSNVFDERHHLQTFCGSPLYASPEIVKGLPYYGPEVDCWSLGVLLYTLVYGAMPFDGSNFKRLVKQITESNYFEPNQKSEASALIKKLLTPNPSERATIIDICTDLWVNRGYEHSLLQVSEDLANLTPVRLEILLALAPVSPSADKTTTIPLNANEVENMALNENNSNDIKDSNESANDGNPVESNAKKRLANTSFDKSLSLVSTQTPKKKKTKKSENNSKSIENNVKENIETKNKQIIEEEVKEDVIQNEVLSCDKSLDSVQKCQQMPQNVENFEQNNEQIKAIVSESMIITPQNSFSTSLKSQELPINANKVQNLDKNSKLEKEINENIDKNEAKNKSNILDEIELKANIERDVNKEMTESKSHQNHIEENETKNVLKVKRNRSSSAKRPGKLSIPNLWNKNSETIDLQMSSTMRRDSQTSDIKSDRKALFIPVGFRVSDAKKAIERRCSVPANTLYCDPIPPFNKKIETKISEESTEDKQNIRQRAPKLNTRSMSSDQMLASPKKVLQLNESLKKKENIVENIDAIEEDNQNITSNQTINIEESMSSLKEDPNKLTTTQVLNKDITKDIAKDIVKKSIARAKLMEKRQTSSEPMTSTTTPLVSIENSDVSILSESSTSRKPRQDIREESDKPSIDLKVDINIKPKSNESMDSLNIICKDPALETAISSDMITTLTEDKEKKELLEQTKATPIARSYKKVTFTKDGACITETGKIYASEGTDGSYTRVEKKSKVTHFPSVDDQSNQSTGRENSLQHSDSQSSSGSLDIFDDIFDNHWSGEFIFPNMRSLLHGVVGNRKPRRRSRAESCERNASDWFGSKRNLSAQSDHESETDDLDSSFSRSLWSTPKPHSSLFDSFSQHFKEFDKDFKIFDDSSHSFRDMNRSISRDRNSFSSRIHPSSYKTIFGPQTTIRSSTNKSLDSDDAYGSTSRMSLINNSNTRFAEDPMSWSREPVISESSANLRKNDSFDSSRKRVEQWLQSDSTDENSELFDKKTPFSMYATVGPRGVRRYLRTISGRSYNDKQNNELMNSSSGVGVFSSQQNSTQSSTVPKDSVIEMKFSLNPNIENNSNCQTSAGCEPSLCSDDYKSNIIVPESSSLLDQLRTHGYRNIVSQRLSGSSLVTDLESNLSENETNYKRGKSVLNSSSNLLNDNQSACECMDETNTTGATVATNSGPAIASHINANNINDEFKAFDCFANRVEFDSISETLNHCLNHTVNQQSCEPTTRSTESNSKTVTDDLPECNPSLKSDITSNNVNFKESVLERIHRKSYYSRFNDLPVRSSRQRRRSFIDNDDVSLALGPRISSLSSRNNNYRNSVSIDDSKPFSSDWFQRMESKASQLMNDLLANDEISSSRHLFRDRERQENSVSFGSRRRSSSSTRSPFSTSRLHKSDFDSYFNSVSDSLNNNREGNKKPNDLKSLVNEFRSPTDVLKKAIDLLSQND